MKHALILLAIAIALLHSYSLAGQKSWSKYDSIVSIDAKDPEKLAEEIAKAYDSDVEKVEAIYYWITKNIAYDVKLYNKYKRLEKKKNKKKYSRSEIIRIEEKELNRTLNKKKGVCKQYAQLMSRMCNHLGIESAYISGWGKTNPKKSRSSGEKHAWTAVKLQGEWHLFEPTWGSGGVDEDGQFHFQFDPNHAFVDPNIFAMNHYPRKEKWQLQDTIITRNIYRSFPVIGPAYLDKKITSIHPSNNTINVIKGDTVVLRLTALSSIEELHCYNLSKEEHVEIDVSTNGSAHEININTAELRSGYYSIFADRKLLLTYKLFIKKR